MDSVLFKLFGVEKEKSSMLLYILLQALLMGVFYGVYNIVAHSILLSNYEIDALAKAYIYTGLAGIFLTYLYSLLKRWLGFSFSTPISLFFVLLVTLYLSVPGRQADSQLFIYSLFVSLGPLFIITMMVLRESTDILFSQISGIKLSGAIDSVMITGFIAGSLSVPAMISFDIDLRSMLFVCTGTIFLVFLVQIVLARHNQAERKQMDKRELEPVIKAYPGNRYIRSLGIFAILSVMVLIFVQYSFMAATQLRYPGETEMAKFLGYFEGIMMAIALALNVSLLGYLIRHRGLNIAITISPLLIGVLTIIAIVIGAVFGYLPETQGFLIFFLLLALSRVFSRALNISLEKPAMGLMYRTVKDNRRYTVRSWTDGPVNEFAVLLTGIILFAFGALSFTSLIHFSWLLAAVITVWLIFTFYLYKAYRVSLLKTLSKERINTTAERGKKNLKKPGSVCSSAFFVDNNYFELIVSQGIQDMVADDENLLQLILNKAEKSQNPDILVLLKNIADRGSGKNGISDRYSSLVRKIESKLEKEGIGKRKDLVSTIEESKNRKLHLQAIVSQQAPPVVTDLMRLIRDQDKEIIRETLYIAGKFRIKELLPDICECLDNPEVTTDAYAVLKSFGKSAFPSLAGHFYRSSGNIFVRRLIIRLFSESGGREAIDFMLPGLWSANRWIKKESAVGLVRCGYRANDSERKTLQEEIKSLAGLISWNLGALTVLRRENDKLLPDALAEETDWLTELLFDLLSVCYNSELIQPVRENLKKISLESINNSLELLNIAVDDDLKPLLTAFMNDILPGSKQNNLKRFYPYKYPDYELLIQDIINKDYNHVGVWAKTCALQSLYSIKHFKETDSIVALLFGVNRILREEAFRYLQERHVDVYNSCSYRLPVNYRMQMDAIARSDLGDHAFAYNRLVSLSGILPCIPRKNLVRLALNIEVLGRDEVASLDQGTDYLLWSSEPDSDQISVYINWSTTGQRIDPAGLNNKQETFYMLPLSELELFAYYHPDNAPELIQYIDRVLKEGKQLVNYN